MRLILILFAAALAGCANPSPEGALAPVSPGPDTTSDLPLAPAPPRTATTVEQFDTTSPETRAAALAGTPQAGARVLGVTIASLGSPVEPGLWLKTALVAETIPGQVTYQGTTVNLELRPLEAAAGSGSQISLAAIRLIGAPLTSLPEVTVLGAP